MVFSALNVYRVGMTFPNYTGHLLHGSLAGTILRNWSASTSYFLEDPNLK